MPARRTTASATDPNTNRPNPLRSWVDIAIRSACGLPGAGHDLVAASPRLTWASTRTPWFRRSAASGARYSSASTRCVSRSPTRTPAAPRSGPSPAAATTRSSTPPCRADRRSAGGMAGSPPRTASRRAGRWPAYTRALTGDAAAPRIASRGASDARTRRIGVVVLRSTASATLPRMRRPSPLRPWVLMTMRSAPAQLRRLDDGRHRRSVPHARLHVLRSVPLESSRDAREVLFRLTDDVHLHVRGIDAGEAMGLGSPDEHHGRAAGRELRGCPDRVLGEDRTVQRNQDLLERHGLASRGLDFLPLPGDVQPGCQHRAP